MKAYDYRKCNQCGAVADFWDFEEKIMRGSRDSEGFQYEPDEAIYYCPFCHSDDTYEATNEDLIDMIEDDH